MADQVEIYNMALDAMGSQSTVSSPMETSAEAKALNRHWRPAIEQLLRAVHWNFARYQVAATLLKDSTLGDSVPSPWTYEYAYPSDCMLARFMMPSPSVPAPSTSSIPQMPSFTPVHFLIASDNDTNNNPTNVLLTNQPQALLVYTRLIENPSLFDAEFTEGLRLYLAHRIAITLSGDKGLSKSNYEQAMISINQARARNGNEGITVIDNLPEWLTIRGVSHNSGLGGMLVNDPQNPAMIM